MTINGRFVVIAYDIEREVYDQLWRLAAQHGVPVGIVSRAVAAANARLCQGVYGHTYSARRATYWATLMSALPNSHAVLAASLSDNVCCPIADNDNDDCDPAVEDCSRT